MYDLPDSQRAAPGGGLRSFAPGGAQAGFGLRRLAARQALPLTIIALFAWLGWDRLSSLDTARIAAILGAVSPAQWLAGLVFTGVSFWAVGRYDAVVHRLSGTGVSARDAVETGAAAIAIGQTIGMGTVTGALVRWRLLPGLGLAGAMRLSVAVSLSFLAAWAVLAAAVLALVPLPLPVPPGLLRLGAGAVLLLAGGFALASLIRPRVLPGRLARALPSLTLPSLSLPSLSLPSLKAMVTVLGLTALDTLAAGTVLWILLPEAHDLAATQVLAAYLLALGAGLVLTTPGGIGPFEAALLTLLPGIETETLLASIIAYRAVYYALPAILGGLVLIRGPRRAPAPRTAPRLARLTQAPTLPFLLDAMIDHAPRAEAALLRHGRLSVAHDRAGRPVAMVAPTGQSLVMLSDPLRPGADPGDTLTLLTTLARQRLISPVLYKSGARLAATARTRGWPVLAIAREAWLDPRSFTTTGRRRARLRRKLRKATAANITISAHAPGDRTPLPLSEMAAVATDWARTHGGERGFSMGRWTPETLEWAHVFLARDTEGQLLGFITLHSNANEQTLDLMRARADAPDGLMYLLLTRAIETAGRAGVQRFSLAAVPTTPDKTDPALLAALRARFEAASGAAGLRQFKSAFAPHWETLYIAAPSRAALAAGALDITREITRPG